MVDVESNEWKQVCDIIDYLENLGDENILGNCIRMLCANCDEAIDLIIGQYGDELCLE